MEFGPSVVPELREILLSTSEAAFYGPDGRLTEVREVPFLGEWHLAGWTSTRTSAGAGSSASLPGQERE